MRILLLHCDYMEYEVKKKTPFAEDIADDRKSKRMEEVLVAFIAVEKCDEANGEEVVERAKKEIIDVFNRVKASRIMLYPYAHLSASLSSPAMGMKVMEDIEGSLGDYDVVRAPFGWYKAFRLSCKGHPLSELSRTIELENVSDADAKVLVDTVDTQQPPPSTVAKGYISEALKAEEKLESHFYIMSPDGVLSELEEFNLSGHDNLKKFIAYESAGKRVVDRVPPHVELMRRLELVDYEGGSDAGNMRFYPRGRLIKSLLEQRVIDRCGEVGAMEVETPVMYDMEHPTLKRYLDRFPARQYTISTDKKELFLRFAACFGQFLMSHDMTMSHHHLPLKMVELTRYSFRFEQSGELVGLRRLRAFTMPDMHTICADMEQAIEAFLEQYLLSMDTLAEMGLTSDNYEVAVRVTREFYDENKEFVKLLANKVQKPILVEIWDERPFYFVLKFEFNFVDALEKASALSTVQIDVENAHRYGIRYVDEDGLEKEPVILHCSPSGAIERCMYAMLEKEAMKMEVGGIPVLPLWLSPVQVRLIPVSGSSKHMEYALSVAEGLEGVRVDVDDRDGTVGKKVRDAGKEWIPYVVVIGDEEVKSGILSVTIREQSSQGKPHIEKMSVEELKDRVMQECKGMPTHKLPLPMMLSRRPRFR